MSDEKFIEICETSDSMAQAAAVLGLHFNTFKRKAQRLNCYNPNQSGKGISKNRPRTIETSEILLGNHPQYQTFKLKNRLLDEGYFQNKCSVCSIEEWNGKSLTMELDHINGSRTDHRLENLRMICPNCHAQTDTYRAKNI